MSDFDYLFLEEVFIQRIRDKVTGLLFVGGIPDVQVLEDQQQYSPAVYVIYLGDAIGTGAASRGGPGSRVQKVEQHWAFVLALTAADATGTGEQARRQAGPLLGQLIEAITGWQPTPDTAALQRAARQAPVSYSDGYFYYPLVFTTTFMFPRIR